MLEEKKNIVIFGAGSIGRQALTKYKDKVKYFVDNNIKLQGTTIGGIPVKRVAAVLNDTDIDKIIIASKYRKSMEKQLCQMGIKYYDFYLQDLAAYYTTDEVVYNPYLDNPARDVSEKQWNVQMQEGYIIDDINEEVELLFNKNDLFSHVEIETVNRCNGYCDFCPVSKNQEQREYFEMPDSLFQNIIEQLAEINYSGRLALFSNNEPFLDDKIIERHQYAREKLPNTRMHLFTNGTLLTVDKFVKIMQYLDELVIDNYQQELKLLRPCEEIYEYCKEHPEYSRKVTIVLRKPHEILTTRGGDAPNRKEKISYGDARCVLPFKQLIIRPDGKISLCCNDPLGKVTLGDLTKDKILDVWYNDAFKGVRECLYHGRKSLTHCEYCDFFSRG